MKYPSFGYSTVGSANLHELELFVYTYFPGLGPAGHALPAKEQGLSAQPQLRVETLAASKFNGRQIYPYQHTSGEYRV